MKSCESVDAAPVGGPSLSHISHTTPNMVESGFKTNQENLPVNSEFWAFVLVTSLDFQLVNKEKNTLAFRFL